MTDIIIRTMKNCEEDPMWADHAEVPKKWITAWREEIERLRAALREAKVEEQERCAKEADYYAAHSVVARSIAKAIRANR